MGADDNGGILFALLKANPSQIENAPVTDRGVVFWR
jgi:hypothetical protein